MKIWTGAEGLEHECAPEWKAAASRWNDWRCNDDGKDYRDSGRRVGGIVAANHMRRRLTSEHRVVLVERNAEHAFALSFLWLMTGDRRPDQIRRLLKSLLDEGVELRLSRVEAIDLPGRKVVTNAGGLAFDYLVVALGTELTPESTLGLTEASETFFTAEGAARLHERLKSFQGRHIAIAAMLYKLSCRSRTKEPCRSRTTFKSVVFGTRWTLCSVTVREDEKVRSAYVVRRWMDVRHAFYMVGILAPSDRGSSRAVRAARDRTISASVQVHTAGDAGASLRRRGDIHRGVRRAKGSPAEARVSSISLGRLRRICETCHWNAGFQRQQPRRSARTQHD